MNASPERTFRRVAVIDIGASSVRMQVAEIFTDGRIEKLDSFSQGVSLGRDSFSSGEISRETIEDSVNVLRSFKDILKTLRVDPDRDVRVVATSGLREATNRLAFQDRVAIATGFEVETYESADVHRVTYLGLQAFFARYPSIFDGDVAVCEVGGGTTEFLFLKGIDIVFSRTFRLGALRLRGSLESLDGSAGRMRQLMVSRIEPAVQQIQHLVHDETAAYLAMGGDIRFAAQKILGALNNQELVQLPVARLEQFADKLLDLEPEQVAARYKLGLADSQTLGAALLIHLVLARRFGATAICVAPVNLRDSLILEMSLQGRASQPIEAQIVRSAELLGRKFDVDHEHAITVASLACQLFEQLEPLHRLPPRYRIVIHLAALLHECGQFVSSRSHHKHGMYLILNSELFGISRSDQELIALVVRYHRRATPQPNHELYLTLGREQRIAVAKLAAILRVAKALDATRRQRITTVSSELGATRLRIRAEGVAEVSAEQVEIEQDGQMFEDLFGIRPELVGSEQRGG